VHSLRKLLFNLRSRPKTRLAIVFVAINHLSVVALAAAPAVAYMPAAQHPGQMACLLDRDCNATAAALTDTTLSLPDGMSQCGESGPAAACGTVAATTDTVAGSSSLPDGQSECATTADKPLPNTPAACSDTVLAAAAPAGLGASGDSAPVVAPSVPVESLGTQLPQRLTLAASTNTARSGKPAVLKANASSTVTGTSAALEIFDLTSGSLVGACAKGSECSVAYSANSGVHQFAAFITPPSSTIPGDSVALRSNQVNVGWLDTSITASRSIVGPGQPIVLTATSTFDVRQTGRWLEIYDLTTSSRVTYCARGTVCTTSMKQSAGGVHELVGYVTGQPEAVSAPIYVTWLSVTLSATSIGPKSGGSVYLKATTNADLANTPWVVGIYDEQGRLVDHACKTGNTCSVKAWMSGTTTPTYTAMIGELPTNQAASSGQKTQTNGASPAPGLRDVQARSAAIQPTHLLWGVDSCKAFIGDATGDLYPAITRALGTPDFWGRYLTDTVCPGISSAEIALAAQHHMGILPIYNDYNCSNVSSYSTGNSYGVAATAAAARLGIPKGRLVVIDIEPYGDACPGAGNVDSGFIEGWYDGVTKAGYVPGYYGNGTSGSEFASAWCAAVTALPNIATGSDLWSFEPSLLGSYYKANAPSYSPYDTGCAGNIEAWQYQLGGNGLSNDVDQDEALASLALWYP
jgi:hypothetical protein